MKKQKVERLVLDSYLAVIRNSVGTRMFKNFYANVNGQKTDIMKDGWLSTAFYVSGLLTMFKLIKGIHGTVDSTIADLLECGWIETDEPKVGGILVWEGVDFDANGIKRNHKHMGFYIGNKEAISNDSWNKGPAIHPYDFKGSRKIEKMFWLPRFDDEYLNRKRS